MVKLRPIAAALLALASAVTVCATAQAEPLERAQCNALKVQKRTLYTPMVRSALTRGPDWVKEHLHDGEKIEQVRQYLQVEEKVAFRCRTNGVRIPKPLPPSLPDRKPAVPVYIVAGAEATSLMPLPNPTRAERLKSTLGAIQSAGAAEKDTSEAPTPIAKAENTQLGLEATTAPKPSNGDTGASQTVPQSDKTPPSDTKAAP